MDSAPSIVFKGLACSWKASWRKAAEPPLGERHPAPTAEVVSRVLWGGSTAAPSSCSLILCLDTQINALSLSFTALMGIPVWMHCSSSTLSRMIALRSASPGIAHLLIPICIILQSAVVKTRHLNRLSLLNRPSHSLCPSLTLLTPVIRSSYLFSGNCS